jgi:hypothetical protein
MSQPPNETESEDGSVAHVRAVRAKIASQYGGDLRRHVADTDRMITALIGKLGLKQGLPPRRDDRRCGTAGD